MQKETRRATDLNGRSVNLELLENGKGLLEQFVANGDVGYVWSIIVVKTVDVLHDACAVSLDGRQDQQVLQIPGKQMRGQLFIKQNVKDNSLHV